MNKALYIASVFLTKARTFCFCSHEQSNQSGQVTSVFIKIIFSFLPLMLISILTTHAQSDTTHPSYNYDCMPLENPPEFPGGIDALSGFIRENLQFPAEALQNRKQGTVFVQFVVERDSTLTNIHVVRGLGYGCDEEAIRIVQLMPKWAPGSENGKVVRVSFNLPVRFSLPCDTASEIRSLKPGEHDDYYEIIEVSPDFPGGTTELMKFIQKNTHYPQEAKKNKITGYVFTSFVVDETGSITNARIMKNLGYGCDEEALRIIGLMPKWTPAQAKGKPVKCEYNLPIRFGN